MENFVSSGDVVAITAPSGGVTSGVGVLIGGLFGVATETVAEGVATQIVASGIVDIGKTSALAINVGDRLFWDATNSVVNKTSTAQTAVGIAVAAAANPSSTVRMLLKPGLPAAT